MPHKPPMTGDDLHALPDDGSACELIRRVLFRMPMSGLRATTIGSRLLARLQIYVEDNELGVVTGEQGGYRLDPAHPLTTEVAPDVGFIRADRVPSPDSPDYDRAPALAPTSLWKWHPSLSSRRGWPRRHTRT